MSPKRGFGTRPLFLLAVLAAGAGYAQDVPFLESPEYIVEAMLDLAEVTADDIVYDLGSGDGRIVIAAAATRNATAVGIESDPELIELSNKMAHEAGVTESVRFIEGDFFETDFSEATVVAIYLYPEVNRKLKPLFLEQLAPGTRIVSHRYEIGGWTPDKRIKVGDRNVFLYVIPEPEN
ncbi:MAG: methyltransferase domain-containing protein [Acidobacteriota bacterium]|nr:methyltransferase domain-containing protein [Acidobacteriota bacterium]